MKNRLLIVVGDRKYTGIVARLAIDCDVSFRIPITGGLTLQEWTTQQNGIIELLQAGRSVAVHGDFMLDHIKILKEIGDVAGVLVDVVRVKDVSERRAEEARNRGPVMSGIAAEVEEPYPVVGIDHTTGGSVVSPPVPLLRQVGDATELGNKIRILLSCFPLDCAKIHRFMDGILAPYRQALKKQMDAWWEGEGAFDEVGIDHLGYLLDEIDSIREHRSDGLPADSENKLVSLLAAFAAPRCSATIHGMWNRMPFRDDLKHEFLRMTYVLVENMLDSLISFGGEDERRRQYWLMLQFLWDGAQAIFPESERRIFSCGQDTEVVS